MESARKKVLIITYYWPPSGGSGVQRWLKFVKYMPGLGLEPIVFTPANPTFDVRDDSLLRDVDPSVTVIHFPIWEPYRIFLALSRLRGSRATARPTELVHSQKPGVFARATQWLRANMFIPDPRIFWVRPASRFLSKYLKKHGISTVVTTGPPHSMHLIGLKLKKRDPSLNWIADFRDPWSEWGLLETLKVGRRALARHRALEKKVLQLADEVVSVTPSLVAALERIGGRRVRLVTNGYDEEDFRDFEPRRTDRFIIRHIGVVNERCNPRGVMRCVEDLAREHEDFARDTRVEFVGEVYGPFRSDIEGSPVLKRMTSFPGSTPHNQLIDVYATSSLLLLVLVGYKNPELYLPGKLFEYMATGLPVVGVGAAKGDAATLLEETNAGRMFDDDETDAIKDFVLTHYRRWRVDGVTARLTGAIAGYSRRALTEKIGALL